MIRRSRSRPKKYSRCSLAYGSSPTNGQSSAAAAVAATSDLHPLTHPGDEVIQLAVEDVDVVALPQPLFERRGSPLYRPRRLHLILFAFRLPAAAEVLAQVLEQHAQVPVAQAVAEKQEAALAEVAKEDGRDGGIEREPREKLHVILFGDHEVVPLVALGDHRAVHLEDHGGPLQIDVQL